jgi:hypothetical protein
MHRKLYVFTILLLLLVSSSYAAQNFAFTTEVVDSRIYKDEVAEFTITISNFDINSQRFVMYTDDPTWNIYYESSVIDVGAKSERTLSLILDPTSLVEAGKIHAVPITVKSIQSTDILMDSLIVIVDSDANRDYQPAVFVGVDFPNDGIIIPSEPLPLTFRFVNRNALDIKSLTVSITSDLFNDTITIPLGPNAQSTKVLTYQLNPHTSPGTKYFEVQLYVDDKRAGVASQFSFIVPEQNLDFVRNVYVDSEEFLRSQYAVNLTNPGNVASEEQFLYKLSWIERIFTDVDFAHSSKTIDGVSYVVFNVNLLPGESKSIELDTNYRPFVLICVVIVAILLAIVVLYYGLRSPIVITKKVQVIHKDIEGTSKLKIVLDVKNRTGSAVKHVRVLERIPTITEYIDDAAPGTLPPSKVVRNSMKGTLLKWDFNSIDPYEERILTYQIKSKLSILGDLKLPVTMIKFESFGQTRTVTEKQEDEDSDDEKLI